MESGRRRESLSGSAYLSHDDDDDDESLLKVVMQQASSLMHSEFFLLTKQVTCSHQRVISKRTRLHF